MKNNILTASALALATASAQPASSAPVAATSALSAMPLLASWKGPDGGVPPFDQVKVADFKPAIEAGIAAQFKEIDAIADNPAAPTFDNTIVAMEKAGRPLGRALTVFFIYSSNMSSPDYQKVEEEMSPKLAAAQDKVTQNTKLFARIDAVYNSPEKAKLTPEQQRLVWKYWTDFSQAGAKLNTAGTCDGRGTCQPPGLTDCHPFRCVNGACTTLMLDENDPCGADGTLCCDSSQTCGSCI